MQKKNYKLVLLPEGAVVVTKKELDALNTYAEKVRRETLENVFTDFEEILRCRYMVEGNRSVACDNFVERHKHLYGREVCETLINDLKKIERKYKE
jgi:hypothetical protein